MIDWIRPQTHGWLILFFSLQKDWSLHEVEPLLMGPLLGHKNFAVKLQCIYINAIIRVPLNPTLQTPA